MGRRKFHKRSRQKAKFHEVQQSFRQHARSSKRRRYDSKATSNLQQNSPELMLSESQHEDLLYDSKLSPEIVSKSPKIKLQVETCGDGAEIGDDISVRRTEQSQRKSCDFKRNAESTNSLLRLEGYSKHDITKLITGDALDLTDASSSSSLSLNNGENKTADVINDERPAVSTLDTKFRLSDTSQLAMFRSNLESLRDDAFYYETPRPTNPGEEPEMNGQQFPEEKSVQQKDRRESETMDDCRLIDKTLSMNDDLTISEMNNYLDERMSSITKHSSFETVPPIAILQSQHLSESATSCKSDKCRSESTGDVRLSLDEFQPPGSVDERNKLWDNPKRSRNILNGSNKRFDVVLETIGKHLTVNWRELRKIFARLNKRIHEDEDDVERDCAPLLSKYRWFADDRRIPYVSISMSSPKNANRSSASCNNDEDEEAGRQRRSTTRVEVPPALSEERRKRKQLSFPPTQPSCDKTCRDSRSSESTSTSDLDQPALTDYDSLQEIECQAGTCKRQVLQTTATSQDSQNHAESRQRSIPRMIISWVIAFYGWLKKKLLHLSDNYKKLRQRFISSPLISEIKTDRLVATLRIENKKMMCELSERMTRLSTDFNKVRTNTETTLNVLTTEVNAVREASKKMNENNTMLMLELKKLRGTLEEIESKSSQPAFLRSSYLPPSSHSLPPPPAPSRFPPSQPPPIASDSTFKSATSTSVIPPPPPPPPPSVFLQSPGPSTIQPTTPNSSRSSKCRTPTRKCSTPLLSRPSITVEDLLKVTLKKAPQSIKDNRRNSMPGPRGPVVSLEMLRNVKLKSTKRRLNDQTGRSPRSGRIVKNRATSNISLSPILTGSEGNLERILRRVDSNRPRRLLSASSSLHEHDFVKETQSQSLETLTRR
ncbi:hypothetical protein DMN91_003030 [Ooceraea biroi]|uniref:Uncharacterized protein n=1 Tax=Ooceraea biroi TaxID=2015173 RepID=A0A3L8DYB4_OOCBI|nr:uncharacterized protein LOC105276919 isoform X1 [Ooceraea biroi]RLU24939.1 hypothetical protein DMN91_003030 [Ooceraea biroi]